MRPALELTGITKRFGNVTALEGARFDLAPGEIHALLGQNGAGKTTLGKVVAGLVRPDAGTLELDGETVVLRSVADARDRGIRMVHQHFSLVPRFTGLDNIRLFNRGAWTERGLEVPAYRKRVLARAGELGLPVQLDTPIEQLGVGDRQRIEVLKALMSETRILILDEPTAVLTPREIESLFAVLRSVAKSGTSICLIGHKLDEILQLAGRVTVLRDGQWALTDDARNLSSEALARAMVGGSTEPSTRETGDGPVSQATGEVVASLQNVALVREGANILDDLSLDVRRGEILGVAGVEGNGQRELASVLAGLTRPDRGAAQIPERVGWIPQDRTTEGLIGDFTLTENLALALHQEPAYTNGPFLNWGKLETRTDALIQAQGVRTSGPGARAGALSGGNQQKLLTARELERSGDLLVAESPTRGLDVHAAALVHSQIRKLVTQPNPAAVVLISTDLDEVLALSHRVVVMAKGTLKAVEEGSHDRDQIGRMMLGADEP
ncbi:MAG: ABC transporter ATP-binding protein [Longimicrobiales bacterium]